MFIEITSCEPVELATFSNNSAKAWDIKGFADLNTLKFEISGRIKDPHPKANIYDWVAQEEFLRRTHEACAALSQGTAANARQAEENAKHF